MVQGIAGETCLKQGFWSLPGSFQLLHPLPGEVQPDFHHRMFRPRYKPLLVKPAPGKGSAKFMKLRALFLGSDGIAGASAGVEVISGGD